jgi:hypothetical protein
VNKPLISVVIPTRNRPDTLEVCLRAMAHHKSPRIEIVVQDNSTNPDTMELVTSAAKVDSRIRYSQAPYPTSQRHNFELGLAAASGDYLTIIGDDDGFSLGSLDWLVERLSQQPVDAVRWNLLHYVWPSLSEDDEGFMDLYHSQSTGAWSIHSGPDLAKKVLRAETQGSWENILVYHGMISRRVYEKMRAMTNGVFFAYPMPDVFAHNVAVFFCEDYLQINDIVSIYGVSGHSAGASWTQARSETGSAAKEGNRWMLESVADEVAQKLPWQPDIRTLRYHDFAALNVAQSFGMLGGAGPDPVIWKKAILDELRMNSTQIAPWFNVEPKAAFDKEIIEQVCGEFRNQSAAPARTSNKKKVDNRIPSLRVQAVDSGFNDDVEGAMLALAALIGPGKERFAPAPAGPEKRSTVVLREAAMRCQKMAPRLTSKIVNGRYMPTSVYQFLKALRWAKPEPSLTVRNSYELHKEIVEKTKRHAENRSTGPEPGL